MGFDMVRKGVFAAAMCVAVLMGCSDKKEVSFEQYHQDGRAKPKVAFVPIKDAARPMTSWDLSEELASLVKDAVLHTSNLYLSRQEKIQDQLSALQNVKLAESNTLKDLRPNEFIVKCEVLQHEAIPAHLQEQKIPAVLQGQISHVLNMRMRVTVVDIRSEESKVILQETISMSELVDHMQALTDYQKISVDSEEYKTTPLYRLHKAVAMEVGRRLDEYITIAKSRPF